MQQELFPSALEWAINLTTYQFATLRDKAPDVWWEIRNIRADVCNQWAAAEWQAKRKAEQFKVMQDDINSRLIRSTRHYI